MRLTALKLLLPLLSAMLLIIPLHAETAQVVGDSLSLRQVFIDTKSPALQLLSRDTRLDMLESFDAHKDYIGRNLMEGECKLLTLTDNLLSVRITGASTLQMKILDTPRESLVAMIYTVDGGDFSDSQLLLYDSRLQPLDTRKYFTPPTLKDFISPDVAKSSVAEIETLVPFIALCMDFPGNQDTMLVQISLSDLVSKETWEAISPAIQASADSSQSLLYCWDGKKFRPQGLATLVTNKLPQ